jgi:hypothetical protein
VGTLVDVGGGHGRLLAEVLAAHPAMLGTLVERAETIRQAAGHLSAAGVLDRVDLVEGDFFEAVPAGADVYVLCRCLHNWDDDHALGILRTVRDAMGPDSRLIVLEEFLAEGPAPGRRQGSTKIVDLLMLLMLEGRDRTEDEYRALLAKAGLTVIAARPAAGLQAEGVIEAGPA